MNLSQLAPAPTASVPERTRTRRGATAIAETVVVVVLVAWWALRPFATPELGSNPLSAAPPSGDAPTLVALDEGAFRAPLWIAAPAPPAPAPEVEAKPEPPPPPLKLQILAIARDDGGDRALLYDPDTDRPTWVKAGESIGPRKVEKVTASAVEIRDGKHLRTLALRETKGVETPLERALRSPGGKP